MGKKKPYTKKGSRKESLYQKISKQFTKYNNTLPKEAGLSLSKRREYIKNVLKPQFESRALSRIRAREIKAAIQTLAASLPAYDPDFSNPLLLNPGIYVSVTWFDIDNFIKTELPDSIYVSVVAGTYGNTKIFFTKNYNYTVSGVRDIVENIRKDKKMGSDPFFTGSVKVRPGMQNDGKGGSYYLEMVFSEIDNAEEIIESENVGVTEEAKELRKKKSKKVDARFIAEQKKLISKKRKKYYAFYTLKKKREAIELMRSVRKSKKRTDFLNEYKQSYFEQVNKFLAKGTITKQQAKAEIEKFNQVIKKAM